MGLWRADDAQRKTVLICAQLGFRTPAHDHVRAVEPHHRWVREVSVRLVGERCRSVAEHERDEAVGGAEVKPYDRSHATCRSSSRKTTSTFSRAITTRGGSTDNASSIVATRSRSC